MRVTRGPKAQSEHGPDLCSGRFGNSISRFHAPLPDDGIAVVSCGPRDQSCFRQPATEPSHGQVPDGALSYLRPSSAPEIPCDRNFSEKQLSPDSVMPKPGIHNVMTCSCGRQFNACAYQSMDLPDRTGMDSPGAGLQLFPRSYLPPNHGCNPQGQALTTSKIVQSVFNMESEYVSGNSRQGSAGV